MNNQPALYHRMVVPALAASFLTTQMAAQQGPLIPGACDVPASTRSSDVGCYLSATQTIETLPDEPVFWHLYTYPTRAAAEAASRDSSSTVAESFNKV